MYSRFSQIFLFFIFCRGFELAWWVYWMILLTTLVIILLESYSLDFILFYFLTHSCRYCSTTVHDKHCIYHVAPLSCFTSTTLHIPKKSSFMIQYFFKGYKFFCDCLIGLCCEPEEIWRELTAPTMPSEGHNFNICFLNLNAWPLSKRLNPNFRATNFSMQLNPNTIHCRTPQLAQILNKWTWTQLHRRSIKLGEL